MTEAEVISYLLPSVSAKYRDSTQYVLSEQEKSEVSMRRLTLEGFLLLVERHAQAQLSFERTRSGAGSVFANAATTDEVAGKSTGCVHCDRFGGPGGHEADWCPTSHCTMTAKPT